MTVNHRIGMFVLIWATLLVGSSAAEAAKKAVITGVTTVKEGDTLNLTCTIQLSKSHHTTHVITWTKLGSNKSLQYEDTVIQPSPTATLVIRNVTAEHSGKYICTHRNTTLTAQAEVTVTRSPKILNNSGCEVQLKVLTCVCISEGFPLPTVNLSLFSTQTEHSLQVVTSVSNHTVVINASVSGEDHSNTIVGCFSSNILGVANESLKIKSEAKQEGASTNFISKLRGYLKTFKKPQVIIAFFIGIVLSSTICCLARKCHRKKQKNSRNMVETLEMVTTGVAPLVGSADVELKEVEYSNIDFSRWSPTGPQDTQETTETEYAEIKKDETEDRQDVGVEDSEKFEGSEEEVVITGEDEETEQCLSPERADVAV